MRNYILIISLIIPFILSVSVHAEGNNLPHVEAINLVVKTQVKSIREIDQGNWWQDTKLREWSARRPFAPGTVDSTHMFIVTYKIEGKPIISWSVNTEKKTVSHVESPK